MCQLKLSISCLKPSLSFKPKVNDHRDHQHCPQREKVPVMPAQFRHKIKIHTVDPHYKSQGHEEYRKNSEYPHNLTGSLGSKRDVNIEQMIGFIHYLVDRKSTRLNSSH